MATVKFRLRKVNHTDHPILIRLITDNEDTQTKTGFTINPKDWSDTKRLPKQNSDSNKKIFIDLKKLASHIFLELNISNSKGDLINRYWLEEKVKTCFNRIDTSKKENNLLTFQTQHIIDNANTRKIKGSNKIGLSQNRKKGYVTFKNLIIRYEKFLKKEITLTEISSVFVDKFTNWLMNTENYSVNYSGKQIDNLKTVGIDAQKRGIKTNDFINKIESFKENKEDKHIITLSFKELEIIRTKEIKKESLINARKWLLLGCEIGQRGGDLLNISKDDIRYSNNNLYIDVQQQKTGKSVTIPISQKYIEEFILNDFPHKISIQKLNEYFKDLCEICKINESTIGKKYDKESKRKKLGTYKKHELITSHICRRSFATNYYITIPTPILIEITGHSKESLFLEYIGKPKDKDENANLFLKLVNEMNREKTPNLKAV